MSDKLPAWRQDFPIDTEQDQYVERRDLLKFFVLISSAFTAGQFWIAVQSWFRGKQPGLVPARIASLDDVPVGGVVTFNYPEAHDACVLVRTGETALVAYSQKCTHLSCAVIPNPAEGVLRCPCHDGLFELPTGRPIAGPPTRPLPRILLETRGREVYATGVDLRTN